MILKNSVGIRTNTSAEFNVNNQTISDENQIAEEFNNYF